MRPLRFCAALIAATLTACFGANAADADRRTPAGAPKQAVRVFFLGNSLTYMGPQWDMLKKLAAGDPGAPAIETGHHVVAACSLARHWKMGEAQTKLKQGRWDAVVIQGYRGGGIAACDEPEEVFAQWIGFVKDLGARPVLYHTAVNQMESLTGEDESRKRKAILAAQEQHLTRIARQHGAWVVPAARAHWIARGADPNILELRWPMFPRGDCHANALGQYLIALTMYPVLTGRQVVGNPWRDIGLPYQNAFGGVNPDAPILAETEAKWLQSVAWAAVSGFHKEARIGDGYILPAAPAADALLDATKPEPIPEEQRRERAFRRRCDFLSKTWTAVQAQVRNDRQRKPLSKRNAGFFPQALKASAADYPAAIWPPEQLTIRNEFAALPE